MLGKKCVHIKTGKPYILLDENLMIKQDGKWVGNFCLYKADYENPVARYFSRPKENFFEKFKIVEN